MSFSQIGTLEIHLVGSTLGQLPIQMRGTLRLLRANVNEIVLI